MADHKKQNTSDWQNIVHSTLPEAIKEFTEVVEPLMGVIFKGMLNGGGYAKEQATIKPVVADNLIVALWFELSFYVPNFITISRERSIEAERDEEEITKVLRATGIPWEKLAVKIDEATGYVFVSYLRRLS